ncbi:MAG: 4-hydroxythreonine-4-phosphate dehydrogenase PdxA [Syntrophorhabdaceae bacterium]|nr:4-hydroxythreonine-4-phosphate dehydrogenase PdxA [Syntrophorhabdaceae bacterium]
MAVTMGDPAGIGGEIIVKSLKIIGRNSIPVIIGDRTVLEAVARYLKKEDLPDFKGIGEASQGGVELIDMGSVERVHFGVSDPEYGKASYRYINEALNLLSSGVVSAIVTCPINKKSIHSAGIPFIGHTEMLADFAGVKDFVMMMANRRMRVSLVTIHIPLKEVPRHITTDNVLKTIRITDYSLSRFFVTKKPRIKVCGLNPHAGEKGLMGEEESSIEEAIGIAKALGIDVEGPYPADTLFHAVDCDAYIAMYHDQGLIPVKTTDFERTVNITLGLPFVRTSPGHGTGYDIAGRGLANPLGLIEAYEVAEGMVLRADNHNLLTKS